VKLTSGALLRIANGFERWWRAALREMPANSV
jgi:hypothetical protein